MKKTDGCVRSIPSERAEPHPLPALLPRAANGGAAVLSGVLRGTRRQKEGAVANACCNWAVGVPLQVLLAFGLGRGVRGLWWALAASAVLQTAVLALLAWRMRWDHEATRARRLVRRLSSVRDRPVQ